ncbi:chromatin assembly factor 1 subunit A-A-like [Dreissena polymorpha]|uniref:chromatin assembly factor 1 subunit A-A-like n=1 Tax=Dreissena polymorpha TaxID=45954 RepID=UPI002264397A|nr:chromatin assembly factor 1 subunit A-A-like [Dreissena polymorpha]
MMDAIEVLPSKKMKQGRLPFKPLDHTGQTKQGSTPPGNKKRKLSDNESPSAKQIRTSLGSTQKGGLNGEHEVSSSSEAENAAENPALLMPGPKMHTLDKFFSCKKPIADQEEITSTNQCIEIDLTEESNEYVAGDATKENKEVDVFVKESIKIDENSHIDPDEDLKVEGENKENDKTDDVMSIDSDDGKEENEDCNASFIANTSVCEDALKTPAKSKDMDSIIKSPSVSEDNAGLSQGSGSEGTPSLSGKKQSKPLSESKRKDRDAQRQKQKEERDREKEDKRLAKEREKEEKKKELAEKKRLKDEQREKEKAEKEKAKQEEKDKKEKERLEKLKQKEEEKKMKEKEIEAKQEEKRQKEEEKRLKEEARKKEEEEKQRKAEKKASMFKGFFIKKEPGSSPPKNKDTKDGMFMPFELKPNMRLAPANRRAPLDESQREKLDEWITEQTSSETYLKALKSPGFVKGKGSKTWPKQLEEDDDVELMSHEKETIEKVTHRVKFLRFQENTRPPYYGTWRKKSSKLTPRNPFKQDQGLFDYEVDSDDEWEEEEPGESVSSDEEEREEEKCDDEEEGDDWMVPHGYLSDGEGIEDEEEVDTRSKQDLQRVRQAAWESELRRQAKPLKMLAIGCHWQDSTTTIAAQQLQILLKFKAICLTSCPIETSYSIARNGGEAGGNGDKTEEKKTKSNPQKKAVPEEAMPDLIRLVHGNPMGIKNLVKEFFHYWNKKTNPDQNTTLDTSKHMDVSMEVDEKSDQVLNDSKLDQPEFSTVCISKRQLDIKIPAIAVREKRPDHKKVCWYVHADVLKQYGMEGLKLPNSWEYVCVKEPKWAQDKTNTPKAEDSGSGANTKLSSVPKIVQFAQPMSLAQIQAMCPAPVKEAHTKVEAKIEVMELSAKTDASETTPGKAAVPPDQKSIKDMFSPLSKKSITCGKPSGLVKAATNLSSPKEKPSAVSTASTPAQEVISKNVTPLKPTTSDCKSGASSPMPNILLSMLSSPELMKASLKEAESKTESRSKAKEEPMDIDIIVLD